MSLKMQNQGKKSTINFRDILSMPLRDRYGYAKTEDGRNYLEALTPTQYAQLFPDYYRRRLPDIGQVMTGSIPGRHLPTAAAVPGVGQPATAASRVARRSQSGAPGTSSTPDSSPPSRPAKPSSLKQPDINIWQGGTPTVNKSGELPGPGIPGALREQRQRFFEALDKKPALKAKLLAIAANEQGTHPEGTQAVIEETINRAIVRGGGVEGGLARLEREIRWTSEGGYYEDTAGQGRAWAVVNNVKTRKILEASYEKVREGGNVSNFAYGNASAGTAKNKITGAGGIRANPTKEINGETFFEPNSDEPVYIKNYSAWKKELLERAKEQSEQGGDPPSLSLFTPEALAQGDPKKPTATALTQTNRPPIAFGDSITVGMLSKTKSIERGYAREGAGPAEIAAQIKEWEKSNPGGLKGRKIYLSTGLLNNPLDVASVKESIEFIKSSGGTVVLQGGPQGPGTRQDLAGVHHQISSLAIEHGVEIGTSYEPGKDGVHPNSYGALLPPEIKADKTANIVQESYGVGMIRGQKTVTDEENAERQAYMSGRISFEGFEDENLIGTSFRAGSGGSEDYPSVPYGTYKLTPQSTGSRISEYYRRGGIDPTKGAFNKVYNVGTPRSITGTGYDPKVGRNRSEIQIHSNVRSDIKKLVSSGCLTVTPAEYPKLIESIERARELSGGNVSLVVENDGQGGARFKIMPSHLATNPISVNEAAREASVIRDAPASQSYRHLTERDSDNKPLSFNEDTGGRNKKLFFNTGRPYTESEVKSMIDKHGKDIVIGANMDSPEEYAQVQAIAEKYGIQAHGYSMGRGAPQSGWGNQFPEEQKEIKKRAAAMGISVEKWYAGGWMDYEMERLKSLGRKAPAQAEFDNFNDAKTVNAVKEELLRFDAFRRDNNIATRIVPKNFSSREYDAYNELVQQNKISPDLLVPLNIVESKYIKGVEKATKDAGHSYGNMPDGNIKEYATKEPLEYKDTAPLVKANKYGGVMQSPTGEQFSLYDHESGKTIGTVSQGEQINFTNGGQIEVTPQNRTYPGDIIDQSMKTLTHNLEDAHHENDQNNVISSNKQDNNEQSSSFMESNWRKMIETMTEPRMFDSASFHRATAASRFQKVGDSVIGGHFDEYSTAIV